MRFAKQTIGLYVSGILGLTWIAIFFHPLFLSEAISGWIKSNLAGPNNLALFIFIIFPLAYAFGAAMNTLFGRLFSNLDDIIRKEVFQEEANRVGEKDLGKLYHQYRYQLYDKGDTFYEYLNFHREGIRMLRSMCVHCLLIFLAFFTIFENPGYMKPVGYVLVTVSFFTVYIFHPKIDLLKIFFFDSGIVFILTFLIAVIMCLFFMFYKKYDDIKFLVFPITLLVSYISFKAWQKKQKNYYKTIINAKKAVI